MLADSESDVLLDDRRRDQGLSAAGLATQSSSDLAAAEALESLGHSRLSRQRDAEVQECEAMSQDEHDEQAQAAELAASFRVPAPPVPLWVQGGYPPARCVAAVLYTFVMLLNSLPVVGCVSIVASFMLIRLYIQSAPCTGCFYSIMPVE